MRETLGVSSQTSRPLREPTPGRSGARSWKNIVAEKFQQPTSWPAGTGTSHVRHAAAKEPRHKERSNFRSRSSLSRERRVDETGRKEATSLRKCHPLLISTSDIDRRESAPPPDLGHAPGETLGGRFPSRNHARGPFIVRDGSSNFPLDGGAPRNRYSRCDLN